VLVNDYVGLMDRLLELPSATLLTTGRTGTDFLQSLLDSHPEVLMFNGKLFYHTFWNNSVCVAAGEFELDDFLDEFIGKHINLLRSKYDLEERKNQLGENCNQAVNIDLARFKCEAIKLLEGRKVDSKSSMVAIYAAYSMCLGQDIKKKTLLFHHQHHFEKLGNYLKDFPDSKVICMTRDPRQNFISGIEHWRKYDPSTDCGAHLYFYIKRILADATVLEKYNNEYTAIRIEDLGKDNVLKELSGWLGISYNECLKESTWGGLRWRGDRLSAGKNEERGWSKKMLKQDWEKKLGFIDKYVLNYIMFYRLRHYGYRYRSINVLSSFITLFLILCPLSYERRFFSYGYMRDCLRNGQQTKIVKNALYLLRRICLFMKYYADVTRRKKFTQPFLSCK
jgi:hypothetical protein